jgi:hypothetical protein
MCPYRAFGRLLNVQQIRHTVQCHIVSKLHKYSCMKKLNTILRFLYFFGLFGVTVNNFSNKGGGKGEGGGKGGGGCHLSYM